MSVMSAHGQAQVPTLPRVTARPRTPGRALSLGLVLLVGLGILLALGPVTDGGGSMNRWPTDRAVFTVDRWSTGPEQVQFINQAHFITYRYRKAGGVAAELVLKTSVDAKRIYLAGPEVPYLGNGYTVVPAPAAGASAAAQGAFVGQREAQRFLVNYAIGERRGFTTPSVPTWALVGVDALSGQGNTYYELILTAPIASETDLRASQVAALADQLFPRIRTWYTALPSTR